MAFFAGVEWHHLGIWVREGQLSAPSLVHAQVQRYLAHESRRFLNHLSSPKYLGFPAHHLVKLFSYGIKTASGRMSNILTECLLGRLSSEQDQIIDDLLFQWPAEGVYALLTQIDIKLNDSKRSGCLFSVWSSLCVPTSHLLTDKWALPDGRQTTNMLTVWWQSCLPRRERPSQHDQKFHAVMTECLKQMPLVCFYALSMQDWVYVCGEQPPVSLFSLWLQVCWEQANGTREETHPMTAILLARLMEMGPDEAEGLLEKKGLNANTNEAKSVFLLWVRDAISAKPTLWRNASMCKLIQYCLKTISAECAYRLLTQIWVHPRTKQRMNLLALDGQYGRSGLQDTVYRLVEKTSRVHKYRLLVRNLICDAYPVFTSVLSRWWSNFSSENTLACQTDTLIDKCWQWLPDNVGVQLIMQPLSCFETNQATNLLSQWIRGHPAVSQPDTMLPLSLDDDGDKIDRKVQWSCVNMDAQGAYDLLTKKVIHRDTNQTTNLLSVWFEQCQKAPLTEREKRIDGVVQACLHCMASHYQTLAGLLTAPLINSGHVFMSLYTAWCENKLTVTPCKGKDKATPRASLQRLLTATRINRFQTHSVWYYVQCGVIIAACLGAVCTVGLVFLLNAVWDVAMLAAWTHPAFIALVSATLLLIFLSYAVFFHGMSAPVFSTQQVTFEILPSDIYAGSTAWRRHALFLSERDNDCRNTATVPLSAVNRCLIFLGGWYAYKKD